MGAGHAHPLHRPGTSRVHRAPVEVKLVCAVVAVFAVVATPRDQFWAFGVHLAVLAAVWVLARIPLRWLLPRMVIEVPFVILAVLLPFTEGGDRVDVVGLSLSQSGLLAAWGIVVKGTLGVLISLTLAATTAPRELPVGLQRLRTPAVLMTIVVLMLRYIDLLVDEGRRMRVARLSRGDDPRTFRQVAATARGVGGLFLRAYERGEHVHLAMLSRGFTGALPELSSVRTRGAQWVHGVAPAAVAVAVAVGARVLPSVVS